LAPIQPGGARRMSAGCSNEPSGEPPAGSAGRLLEGASARSRLRLFPALPSHWIRAPLARRGMTGRSAVVAVPYLWLLLFFLVPFVIVLKIAFSESQIAMPPYAPLLLWTQEQVLQIKLNLGNFLFLFE